MNHSVRSNIVHLDDVADSQVTGDGDLVGEGGDGELLPGPRHQGGGALREGAWQNASSSHVSQQSLL